ncbi:1-phosphofructokinase [Frankia sp. AgB1.9]|uniref:1-phosphofructokinase family hexose kinase n=1 Tax=unclassified Frankia TaxID=2632575 RepID=UPI0019328E7E|nr:MULTISPECIES: PfkB family carbohydrate kinase [unclassified Frankia]MBL7487736.1 1-phosphofructokinase [Frankia sp. AgW1.1]MBL7548021.1 1-phosphofructokinase [Frankia sp. AgB1.9]MBL7622746.1 1-phosphofructokinase [Frankia sp. AgB1.8]
MILCVSASPALDVTYRVERLTVGATNRIRETARRPGGKATNVARLLVLLGQDARLLTTAGGETGAELAAGLSRLGVAHDLVPTTSVTRRTFALVDETTDTVTLLNEPALVDDWPRFVARAAELIPSAEVVVLSGSLPADAPVDGLAQLVSLARAHGRPVVLDASGPALLAALAAGPTVVKPNADELRDCADEADPVFAARSVANRFGVLVVASLGADGLVAVAGDTEWRARPRRRLTGNPTGAGDAVVAALARGLRAGTELGPLLADCVALAAAAVLSPTAGEFEAADYQRESVDVISETLGRAGR